MDLRLSTQGGEQSALAARRGSRLPHRDCDARCASARSGSTISSWSGFISRLSPPCSGFISICALLGRLGMGVEDVPSGAAAAAPIPGSVGSGAGPAADCADCADGSTDRSSASLDMVGTVRSVEGHSAGHTQPARAVSLTSVEPRLHLRAQRSRAACDERQVGCAARRSTSEGASDGRERSGGDSSPAHVRPGSLRSALHERFAAGPRRYPRSLPSCATQQTGTPERRPAVRITRREPRSAVRTADILPRNTGRRPD
jgi:hypothetical protein